MNERSPEAQLVAAFDEHADALFRFCYAFTGEREHARDAVQETYVRAWTYLMKGKRIDTMKPFLYQTARNLLTDWSRQPRTQSLEEARENGFDRPAPDDTERTAQASHAVRLIARLEPAYRDVVTLRFVDDLGPGDIARLTGETENAVSVRIHRGIEQLRELVAPST